MLNTRLSVGLGSVLICSVLALQPGAAAIPDRASSDTAGAVEREAAEPQVRLLSSAWTVQSTQQAMEVRTTYPESTPPESYVGKPVDVQVLLSDGTWQTVGTADQVRVGDEPRTTATVGFTFPEAARVRIRARAHPTGGTYQSEQALVDVRTETPPFDPTALPETGDSCFEAGIGSTERIVYECGLYVNTNRAFAYDHETGERKAFATGGVVEPMIADHADMAVVSVVVSDEPYRVRARRTDLGTGESGWVALKRNGDPARTSNVTSISANGRRIVYTSKERGIVPDAPPGENIYLRKAGATRSTFIGRGSAWGEAEISGDGRFIAWRSAKGGHLRRTNVETGRTRDVPGAKLSGGSTGPSVNSNGRYIAYAERVRGKAQKRVRVYDARTAKTRTIGKGDLPAMSPDGSMVAYRAVYRTELRVWNRTSGESTLVTVGREGDGAGYLEVFSPDFSANGRWLIAHADSALVAPDNGHDPNDGRNDLILFDLESLKG